MRGAKRFLRRLLRFLLEADETYYAVDGGVTDKS